MYQKRTNKKTTDHAVSPVVGVMLMLVVTIIIAAVVAVFASGAISGVSKTPTASFETKITCDDSTSGSNNETGKITITAIATSEPIDSKDLMITIKAPYKGTTLTFTTVANTSQDNLNSSPYSLNAGKGWKAGYVKADTKNYKNTYGTEVYVYNLTNTNQWFGNYTITSGTSMVAEGDNRAALFSGQNTYSWSTLDRNDVLWQQAVKEIKGSGAVSDNDAKSVSVENIPNHKGTYTGTVNIYANSGWTLHKKNGGTGTLDPYTLLHGKDHILQPGDSVTVVFTYVPSGQILCTNEVVVLEA